MTDPAPSIVTRQRRLDEHRSANVSSPSPPPPPTSTCAIDDGGESATDDAPTKANRAVHKWQPVSEQLFYEGVKLHGKNYVSIERYMSSKVKNPAFAKNKEQIRHHYYNQVKLLMQQVPLHNKEFGAAVRIPRDVREIFLLVNNALWMKATKGFRSKNSSKLRELIVKGSTSLKVTGKPFRTLRTPHCPALKKYFDDDTTSRYARLLVEPITVELRPRTHADKERVTRAQHNPYVRVRMNAGDALRPLFETLQWRWTSRKSVEERAFPSAIVTIFAHPSTTLTDVAVSSVTENPPVVSLGEYIGRYSKAPATRLASTTDPTTVVAATSFADAIPPSSSTSTVDESPAIDRPPTVTLSADVLRNGLSASNAESLTAGHLALMCSGGSSIRLQYSIAVDDVDEPRLIADRTWRCLVTLLRRGFGDQLGKAVASAPTATPSAVVDVPVVQQPQVRRPRILQPHRRPQSVASLSTPSIVAVSTLADGSDRFDTDYSAFEQQVLGRPRAGDARKRSFATPAAPTSNVVHKKRITSVRPPLITTVNVQRNVPNVPQPRAPPSSLTQWRTPPKRVATNFVPSTGLTRFHVDFGGDGGSNSLTNYDEGAATRGPTNFGSQSAGNTLNTPPRIHR